MSIKVHYYIWKAQQIQFSNSFTLTDDEIEQILLERFKNGELPCPIHIDKDEVEVEFDLENVTF